jgi:hypothetical protein
VASFSQDLDSLPQWRSYCPNGNGVAVGFRVDCLKRAFVDSKGDPNVSKLPAITAKVTFRAIDYVDNSIVESLDEENSHRDTHIGIYGDGRHPRCSRLQVCLRRLF